MKYLFSFIVISLFFVAPFLVVAETYVPISGIPGLEAAAGAAEAKGFAPFINSLYKMAIGAGSALAVIMIIFYGIQYGTSDVVGSKIDLRAKIGMVLGGLGLLLGAFIALEAVNPQLTRFELAAIEGLSYAGIDNLKTVETISTEGVEYESGKSGEAVLQEVTNPTEEEYRALFGTRAPAGRVLDGRVTLTDAEKATAIERSAPGGVIGVTSGSGVAETTSDDEGNRSGTPIIDKNDTKVTKAGQRAVVAAITLCPEIPHEWASSASLFKIIAKESGGQIARPNYALKGYMQSKRISQSQMTQDIRDGKFYTKHCCNVRTRSNEEQQRNGTQRCNGATNSGLMQFTRSQANAGKRGYSHIAGECASAAGFGQLINVNMQTYQPNGVQGFGRTSHEICGMLKYIKGRHGDPENAWRKYVNGVGY